MTSKSAPALVAGLTRWPIGGTVNETDKIHELLGQGSVGLVRPYDMSAGKAGHMHPSDSLTRGFCDFQIDMHECRSGNHSV